MPDKGRLKLSIYILGQGTVQVVTGCSIICGSGLRRLTLELAYLGLSPLRFICGGEEPETFSSKTGKGWLADCLHSAFLLLGQITFILHGLPFLPRRGGFLFLMGLRSLPLLIIGVRNLLLLK